MFKRIFFLTFLVLLTASFVFAGDEAVTPPAGKINFNSEKTQEGASWITVQYIGNAPGMDEYRWYDEDFGWRHTFDPECKDIYDITLTIGAWDVDYAQGERNAIYGDGVFLGFLQGADNSDSETSFVIPVALLNDGELNVWVDIDQTDSVWAVTIDYSSLRTHWDWVPPVADFTASPTSGISPLLVCFTNLSTCADSWLWDFGDGHTSTLQHPCHVYENPPQKYYTVTLTVWGPGGEDTMVMEDLIQVNQAVAVYFESSPIAGGPGLEVAFMNHTGGNANKFEWDFGDGEMMEMRMQRPFMNLTHVYAEPGEYTVTLVGMGSGGSDAVTIPSLVYVDAENQYLELKLVEGGETYHNDGWENLIDHDVWGNGAKVAAVAGEAVATFELVDGPKAVRKIRLMIDTAEKHASQTNWAKDVKLTFMPGMEVVEHTCMAKDGMWDCIDLLAHDIDVNSAEEVKVEIVNARGEHALYYELVEMQLMGEEPALAFDKSKHDLGDLVAVPTEYKLTQNFPNPFNPETSIRFDLPEEAKVTLAIYNLTGQLINTLVDGQVNAGSHNFTWNATDSYGNPVAGGVYIYRLAINSETQSTVFTKKMIYMK